MNNVNDAINIIAKILRLKAIQDRAHDLRIKGYSWLKIKAIIKKGGE